MTVIRAFIAVSLDEEIYRGLHRIVEDLGSRLPGESVRWTVVQNIHLTLKFLGDVSTASLDQLTRALQARVASYAPFEIRVERLGAFPSARRPRIIWVGLTAPDTLHALQHGVEAEMAHLGYPPEERPFSPHLTIGRVARSARPADIERIARVVESVQVGSLGSVRVDAVHLYKSDLRPSGPIYTRLFSAALGV